MNENKYISKDNLQLVIDGIKIGTMADWNQNDSNAPTYVKNRTHWAETAKEIILEETTADFDDFGRVDIDREYSPYDGEIFKVLWNGEIYTCECKNKMIGNTPLTDNGMPFRIQFRSTTIRVMTMIEQLSNTFSIFKEVEYVHELDSKFIPPTIARDADVVKTVNDVFPDESGNVEINAIQEYFVTVTDQLTETGIREITTDKTVSEIVQAYKDGYLVVSKVNGDLYILANASSTQCVFRSLREPTFCYVIRDIASYVAQDKYITNPSTGSVDQILAVNALTGDTPSSYKLVDPEFKNPYALTLTGAVEATYDGSEAISIDIPSQVVDSELSSDSTNPVQNKIISAEISNLNTLIGDTSVADQISTALDSSKADWNQTEETAADYIKNKPLIATDADTLNFLAEISYVTPVANADGSIYANEQGQVYTI